MDEVLEFCLRVLGDEAVAADVARGLHGSGSGDRLEQLAAAAEACRARGEVAPHSSDREDGLAAAVAREMAAATAGLPERQREALALREALGLEHAQVAYVMGIERSAVAPLLARARLRLRAERRGSVPALSGVDCGERALRLLALRQDGEERSGEDDSWLLSHLGACEDCRQAHAAMLEASANYRAWRLADLPTLP